MSENLQALWHSQTTLWFGNSSYQFKYLSGNEPLSKVEVPSLKGLPPKAHATFCGGKPRLGPIVAVLVDDYLGGSKPFSVQTLLLTELTTHAHQRGVLVYIITPNNTLGHGYVEGYSLVAGQWVKQQFPYPDFLYNRYFGKQYTHRDQIIRQLKAKGARLINSHLPNKWECYLWLKTDPLLASHLPETRLYKSIKDIEKLLANYPEIYLKPRAGARGSGIARLSRSGHFYQLISAAGKTQQLSTLGNLPSYIKTNSYIVQQGIRFWNYPSFYDLKVLVQNTGSSFVVTGKIARQAEAGRVTTQLHQGGEALLLHEYLSKLPLAWQDRLEADVDRIALQTAKVLANRMPRLGEFSLDMGLDQKGKVWIIEANGKPSRKSFRIAGDDQARGDAYEHLIDYMLHDYITGSY
ncbi:MAG: YheC/YheD family protein [Methanomassiliicoccales archaeon]